jgi:hypothetical protein
VYLHLKFGKGAPMELIVWAMAEKFGWTLDYIDSIPLARLHEWLQVEEGKAKAMPQPKGKGKR